METFAETSYIYLYKAHLFLIQVMHVICLALTSELRYHRLLKMIIGLISALEEI